MIHRLGQTNLAKSAGLIGRYFHIDPVQVARSTQFEYAFRAAAFRYAQDVERKEAEAQQAKVKKG